jgi:hypothetical protein
LELVGRVVGIVLERKRRSDTTAAHRVLLVVDELANLLAVLDKGQTKQLQDGLAVVAAEGRKYGVHLLAGTQKPLAEVTGNLAKSNMAVRFVGAVTSWQDAQTALDMPASGAERLNGRGDFLVRKGRVLVRFQAPYVMLSTVRLVNAAWRGVDVAARNEAPGAPAAVPVYQYEETPICVENWPKSASTTGIPASVPVQRAQSVPPVPPAGWPIADRPLTPAEAKVVRELHENGMSKNRILDTVWGGKTPRRFSWLNDALDMGGTNG